MKPLALDSLTFTCRTVALLSVCAAASATNLSVCAHGCGYTSIQAAVNAARSGDQIKIGAGTYFENVAVPNKALTIVGAGKDLTTVDGQFRKPVFTLGTPAELAKPKVSLIGMTITHGEGDPNLGGGGVSVLGVILYMQDCIVSSNRSQADGGGIEVFPQADVVHKSDGHVLVRTMVTHNGAALNGGGIHIASHVDMLIYTSTIARNTAGFCGGGIMTEDSSSFGLQNITLTDNIAATDGGGACALGTGTIGVNSSVIGNNHATRDGGGISGRVSMDDTTVTGNTAGQDGGGISSKGADAVIDFGGADFVVLNAAGRHGGGVFKDGSVLGGSNVIIVKNTPDNCVAAEGCP